MHLVKKKYSVRKNMLEKLLKYWTLQNKSYLNEQNKDAIDDLSKYIDGKAEDNSLVSFEHCDDKDKPCESDITYEEGLSKVAEIEKNLLKAYHYLIKNQIVKVWKH